MPPIILPGDPTPEEIAERARQIREEGFREVLSGGRPGRWFPPWGEFPCDDDEAISKRMQDDSILKWLLK